MEISERRERLTKVFQDRFGAAPSTWARAPGRVDLMGSHTDYNLGFVLTLPIGLDTWIAAHPRTDRTVRLYSLNLDAASSFSLDALAFDPEARWSNYVRGVASVVMDDCGKRREEAGFDCGVRSAECGIDQALLTSAPTIRGFDGVIHSTVPMSSGLSSSAALECATATLFEALGGWKLDPIQKALLCQRAENQFVGVNCGILDQYTSCVGQEGCALLLDCRDLSSRPVRLPPSLRVVICDTKSKRELAGSEYGQRRAQCEEGARLLGLRALRESSLRDFTTRESELPSEVAKRCRFIIEENDRVLALARALPEDDRALIESTTAASFRGACDLYEIGAPPMNAMMQAMLGAPGVVGARQAGAGFGGCMVAFVEARAVEEFAAAVHKTYSATTQIQPEVFTVEAAAGAGLLPWSAGCNSLASGQPTPP